MLQDVLNRLGFSTGGLDGVFGPLTAASVRAYQSRRGLAADGVVGCLTWSTMMNQVIGRYALITPLD